MKVSGLGLGLNLREPTVDELESKMAHIQEKLNVAEGKLEIAQFQVKQMQSIKEYETSLEANWNYVPEIAPSERLNIVEYQPFEMRLTDVANARTNSVLFVDNSMPDAKRQEEMTEIVKSNVLDKLNLV